MTETLATGPLDPAAYRQQMLLLKALHHATPVHYNGRAEFVQVLTPRLAGGRVQMDVYLAGKADAIDSMNIILE